jgi:hypothetical protein
MDALRDEEYPKVLPRGAQGVVPGVVPVFHQARNEVQTVAGVVRVSEAFLLLVAPPVWSWVVQHALAQECCLHPVRCVAYGPAQPLCDPDVRHAADPVMRAFQDEARSRSALRVQDDLPHRSGVFRSAEFRQC